MMRIKKIKIFTVIKAIGVNGTIRITEFMMEIMETGFCNKISKLMANIMNICMVFRYR